MLICKFRSIFHFFHFLFLLGLCISPLASDIFSSFPFRMVVKRKRGLVGCATSKGNRKSKGEVVDPKDIFSSSLLHGNTLFELPHDIFLKILLKLPLVALLTCKCVCKSWLSAVSSSHFGQLYLESTPISVFVRTNSSTHVSRTLHPFNFDELGGGVHVGILYDPIVTII